MQQTDLQLIDGNISVEDRIDSFISRKDEQYPELALRAKKEKRAESIGYQIFDKISELLTSARLAKLI